MPKYQEYFDKITYKAKYNLGDRVIGKWNKIPFVGSVGNDFLINHEEGPKVNIHLDLPIKYNGVYHYMIVVKHKDIKSLKETKW